MENDKRKYTLILHDYRDNVTIMDDIWLTTEEINNQESIPYYIHICYLEEDFDMEYFDDYISYIISSEVMDRREEE